MVEIVTAPSALQSGDAAVVTRSGTPAAVVLKEGATFDRGTSAGSLAAGNRGIPTGGTTGQALVKSSGTDYAVAWGDAVGGGGGGLAELAEDTSPQLGGNLDLNGHTILGMVLGTHIQPYSSILLATTASFTTARATKLDALPDSATLTANLGAKIGAASPVLTGTPTAPTAAPGTNNTQLATTAYADAIAALTASLASPALTGTPTAPTAAPSTNTTQIATTAFVEARVASVTASAVTGAAVATAITDDQSASERLVLAAELFENVADPDDLIIIGIEDGAVVGVPALASSGASDRFWTNDAAGAFKQATYAEAKTALFSSLTGGLYSTAGVVTAFAPWGKNNLWIPAGSIESRLTNGATRGEYGSLAFPTGSDTFGLFEQWLPKAYNASTVVARFVWKHAAATTNFSVTWAIQGACLNDNEAHAPTYGTAQHTFDEGSTSADRVLISPATAAIALSGTPAKERLGRFQIYRNVTGNGTATNDDLAVDAVLLGVILDIVTNAATDD